jgi:WD40 repeat protein/tRNA A-37 threonylcarbamoyl transferase component Bud32
MQHGPPEDSELSRSSCSGALVDACAAFLAAWESGEEPRVEAFLESRPEREGAILEVPLVQLEIVLRRKKGESLRAQEYLARFPSLDSAWLDKQLKRPLAPDAGNVPAETGSTRDAHVSASGQKPVLVCPHCLCTVPYFLKPDNNWLCPICGGSFRVESFAASSTVDDIGVLGRFQLLARVGRGTFGEVWRARDCQLDRIVALKIPHPGMLDSAGALERLEREARAAAQLRHPGIVRLYEVMRVNNAPVLVTDFIEGVSLKDLVESRRLSFREAAELAAQVAEALDYSHSRGLVHRDIKPGNIMVEHASPLVGHRPHSLVNAPAGTESGFHAKPIIVDFGLALREETEIVMTVEGQIIGTPAYMSPEQAAGHGHHVDRRSDLYSLGVVLYQLLCGEVPFRGSKAMLLYQVLRDDPRPLRSLNDRIPRDLETICLKAMAKQPGWRYATAGEFSDDLRRFLKGEPIRARPTGRPQRLWRWCLRNRLLAATASLAAAAVLALVSVSIVMNIQQARALRESQRSAATLALQHGLAECDLGNVGPGMLWLARSLEAAPNDDELTHVIRTNLAAWRPWLGPLRAHFSHQAPVLGVALSVEGRTILTGSADNTARLWDLQSGEPLGALLQHKEPVRVVALHSRRTMAATSGKDGVVYLWDAGSGRGAGADLRHPELVVSMAFSPDGKTLAAACTDRNAYLWDVVNLRRPPLILKHEGPVETVAFSPDGNSLLTASADKQVHLWDLATAQRKFTLPQRILVSNVAWSADGSMFLSFGKGPAANLWNAKTGAVLETLEHPTSLLASALSRDARLVFTSGLDQTGLVWDVATAKPCAPVIRHWPRLASAVFTADGKKILIAGDTRSVWLRDVPLGSLRHRFVCPKEPVRWLAFNGPWFFTASGGFSEQTTTVRVWNADTGTLARPVISHPGMILAAALGPDGRTIVTGSTDNCARLLDTETGKLIHPPLHHESWVHSIAVSPNGKHLLTGSNQGVARLWDCESAKQLAVFTHNRPLMGVAFSPQGKSVLTTGGDKGANLWHLSAQQLLRTFPHQDEISVVTFHPNGNLILTASFDKTARIWDTLTGEPVGTPIAHEDKILAAAFSDDGKWIVTGSADKSARVWDSATGAPLSPPLRHRDAVAAVAIHPANSFVITGSDDGTARLWEMKTGKAIGPGLPHHRRVRMVAFHPNGTTFATASEDCTACIWDIPPALTGTAESLRIWTEVMTGMELDANDAVKTLEPEAWTQRRARLGASDPFLR